MGVGEIVIARLSATLPVTLGILVEVMVREVGRSGVGVTCSMGVARVMMIVMIVEIAEIAHVVVVSKAAAVGAVCVACAGGTACLGGVGVDGGVTAGRDGSVHIVDVESGAGGRETTGAGGYTTAGGDMNGVFGDMSGVVGVVVVGGALVFQLVLALVLGAGVAAADAVTRNTGVGEDRGVVG